MKHPKIHPVDSVVVSANVLIYGHSGAGKTYAAGTALGPVLVLDAEGGLMTIRGMKGVSAWTVESYEDVEEAYKYLRAGGHGFATVVMDSLTELQRKIADSIRGKAPTLSMRQYGELKEKTEGMLRAFRDLPVNFVCTALQTDEKGEDGSVELYRPMLVGSVKDTVSQFFDVVGWLVCREEMEEKTGEIRTVRKLITEGGPKWIGKDRSGMLGREAPLNLSALMRAVLDIKADDEADAPMGFSVPDVVTVGAEDKE